MIFLEGGNVFKDLDGQSQTQRIELSDVLPTVKWLESITNLPLSGNMLGSTGHAMTSGDLDLAVDEKQTSKQQLYDLLSSWILSQGLEVKDFLKKSGDSVHFKTPIRGGALNGYVQTDFMMGDPGWQHFSLAAPAAGSQFKGVHRQVVLASIAKGRGFKWSYKNGLMNRETNQTISKDPKVIAKVLVGGVPSDLDAVETILAKIKNDPKFELLTADAREYFRQEGLPFTESNYMARIRDRMIDQNMQPITEAARIEHPEDMIFDQGSNGALQAILALQQLPAQASNITIKWDGKPAIIFGRDPNGQFVLTDKSGFTAKTYQGLAKSPGELAAIMAQRGGERGQLNAMYGALWAPLQNQTPKDFRGYIQGDLLYVGKPEKRNGRWVFKPNTVEYQIEQDSKLGQEINHSIAAVAIHTFKENQNSNGIPFSNIDALGKGQILFVSPKIDQNPVISVPTKQLVKLSQTVKENAQIIDTLFDPQLLRGLKLTNLPSLMKKYGNAKVRQGNFSKMSTDFIGWVAGEVTDTKQGRIVQFLNENKKALQLVFIIFSAILSIKTSLVGQLDSQNHNVQATIDDRPGDEGYVANIGAQPIKLVDRLKFSQANFAKNNP